MNRFRYYILAVAAAAFMVVPANAIVWNAALEATPAAGDPVSQGDDRIRDAKAEIRFRMEVEHMIGDGDDIDDDNGLHRLGSARCYMQNGAPTTLNDSHTLNAAPPTITDYDQTGVSFQGQGDLNDSASQSALGIEDDVGHGRCWIDLDGADDTLGGDNAADDRTLNIFIGEAGDGNGAWQIVRATPEIPTVFNDLPRSYLAGLQMTQTDEDTITVAVGEVRSSANAVNIDYNVAFAKDVDVTWAAGTTAGGLNDTDFAALPLNDTWIHVHVMTADNNPSNTDICFDRSVVAANCILDTALIADMIPVSGTIVFRRIGSFLFESAAQEVLNFVQSGGEFWWTESPGLDRDDVGGIDYTSGVSVALSVPIDVRVIARFTIRDTAGLGDIIAVPTELTGINAGITAWPLAHVRGSNSTAGTVAVLTDTSAQVTIFSEAGGGSNDQIRIATHGWFDPRGRDD